MNSATVPNAPWAPPNTTCYGNLTAPPAKLFNSTPNFSQWVSAFESLGAKYLLRGMHWS